MNDELDLMRRIVDYHDHISAPPVLVADDLQRGRQRVRRRRGLIAGGAALGLASVVVAASLLTSGGPADSPQPAGPPTPPSTFQPVPGNTRLNAPLVAPESIVDVQELGFHVEDLQVLSGTLRSDSQQVEVALNNSTFAVRVHYQGTGPGLTAIDRPRKAVSIHGAPGTFVERYEDGSHLAYLLWEYAPDSWASIWRSDGSYMPSREEEILTIAEAIRSGGEAVRVPFRLGTASAPVLGAETPVEVDLPLNSRYWRASFESGLGITGGPLFGSSCDPPRTPAQFVEPFSYRGDAGCLQGTGDDRSQVSAVVLQVDGTERIVHDYGTPLTGYELEDLKRLLAEITMAPTTDEATWFDLRTAFSG